MSLKSILKEIETNRPNAEMDVTLGTPATYGGRVGLKRAATESMKRLRVDYRNKLMESTVFIVVTGSGRDAFTEVASSGEFNCFTADPEDFFKNLTSRISPTLFGREGARSLFNIAGNILEDKAGELDINSYPVLAFNDKYNVSVKTPEDFVQVIKGAITEQVGSEIVGINTLHSIVDVAIKRGHAEEVTPVLLNTADEKFALDLHKNLKKHMLTDGTFRGVAKSVFLVVAGKASKDFSANKEAILVKKVSEESVGEALASIRNKL
jgi:hypothetical protein